MGPKVSVEEFNALPYVDVHVAFGGPGEGNRMAHAAMAQAGPFPRTVLVVPNFTAAAAAVAHGDGIAGLLLRFAQAAARVLPLKIVELPFPLPPMEMGMLWHERTEADEGSRYFRALVAEALR